MTITVTIVFIVIIIKLKVVCHTPVYNIVHHTFWMMRACCFQLMSRGSWSYFGEEERRLCDLFGGGFFGILYQHRLKESFCYIRHGSGLGRRWLTHLYSLGFALSNMFRTLLKSGGISAQYLFVFIWFTCMFIFVAFIFFFVCVCQCVYISLSLFRSYLSHFGLKMTTIFQLRYSIIFFSKNTVQIPNSIVPCHPCI